MTKIIVLIVEDEPLIAEDIKEHLTYADYWVDHIVYNKEEALLSLSAAKPDIALLDINLGNNMDGIEIAKEINEKHKIPFLYLTSYSSKEVLELAKPTRPMGYIVKPFNERDLVSSIEIALYNFSQLHKPRSFSRTILNEQLDIPLSEKEFEIILDIYEGKTNKQMAERHAISINTIKTHVQKIYDSLEMHSRSAVIAKLHSMLS